MQLVLLGLGLACVLGLVAAPFPYWQSYFNLWKVLLRSPWKTSAKLRLGRYLLGRALRAPIMTFFWYLDEIMYPGYRNVELRPIFIIGQPRCGTTFLHRTLGADRDSFFTVRHIEWRYPSISLQKFLKFTGLRSLLMRSSYWPDSRQGRLAAKMHPNQLSDAEEDGIFFEENFLQHFFLFLRFPDSELLDRVSAFDRLSAATRRRMLEAHRKCVMKVQYMRGGHACCYLSKEVTSHDKVKSLLELYPGARFLVSVRPSDQFMPSLVALVQTSTHAKTGIDPLKLPGWQNALLAHFRRQSELLVDLCERVIPREAQYRISANELMENVVDTVVAIYEFLGLPLSSEFLQTLREIEANQQQRNPGYTYEQIETVGFGRFDSFTEDVQGRFAGEVDRQSTAVGADWD